jgi:hypothetical protein
MKKLFLDDIRSPKDAINLVPSQYNKMYWENDWFVVRDYKEFVKWISFHGVPDLISFDHDLADIHYEVDFSDWEFSSDQLGVEETGLDCAKWLVDYCLDNGVGLPQYIVHSANPAGRKNIQGYLDNATKHLF